MNHTVNVVVNCEYVNYVATLLRVVRGLLIVLHKKNGFLVSKETVVLRPWESENKNLVLSNKLIKVEIPP